MKCFFFSGIGTVLLCLFSIGVYAQFILTAEVRPRTEFSHDYKTLADPNDDLSIFTTQKTRLGLFYFDDEVKAKVVLQDVCLWGSQPQLIVYENFGIFVHEAWVEAVLLDDFSTDTNPGAKLDFMLAYDQHDAVDLSAGYFKMLPSETMQALKGGDKDESHYWAWVMAGFDLKGFLVD
ncbi:MAG: hypothetical protein K9H84_04415 [Bacteroidales bacterium]|nr:hypothetical protein [Bacteroidales bacterium]